MLPQSFTSTLTEGGRGLDGEVLLRLVVFMVGVVFEEFDKGFGRLESGSFSTKSLIVLLFGRANRWGGGIPTQLNRNSFGLVRVFSAYYRGG